MRTILAVLFYVSTTLIRIDIDKQDAISFQFRQTNLFYVAIRHKSLIRSSLINFIDRDYQFNDLYEGHILACRSVASLMRGTSMFLAFLFFPKMGWVKLLLLRTGLRYCYADDCALIVIYEYNVRNLNVNQIHRRKCRYFNIANIFRVPKFIFSLQMISLCKIIRIK